MTTTIYIILHNQQNLAVLCMNLSIPKWKKASTRWKCCVCVCIWLKILKQAKRGPFLIENHNQRYSNCSVFKQWRSLMLLNHQRTIRRATWRPPKKLIVIIPIQKTKENPRGFLHPCSTTGKSAPPVTAPDCFSKQRGLFGRHRAGPTGGRRRDLRNWRLTSVFSSVGSWLSYLGTVKGRVAGKSSEKGSTTM